MKKLILMCLLVIGCSGTVVVASSEEGTGGSVNSSTVATCDKDYMCPPGDRCCGGCTSFEYVDDAGLCQCDPKYWDECHFYFPDGGK